jgi:hypothetical protein
MTFTVPTKLAPKVDKEGNPRTLSKNTIKIYKNRLNKISEKGYSTVDELIESPEGVIQAINDLVPGASTPETRQHKRVYYSAVFYVLPEQYLQSSNSYYKAFQYLKDRV